MFADVRAKNDRGHAMRIAIFENIMTPGGHEVDFDRILSEELTALGHDVVFYVPENFTFAMDYGRPVVRLPKAAVTYTNVRGLARLVATVRRELHRQAWYKALYRHAKAGDFDALIVPTSTYRYLRALKKSPLRHSPVPVLFILHGINSHEAPKFLRAADALAGCKNIRPTVLTFGDTIFGERRTNIRCIFPPTFVPRDLSASERATLAQREPDAPLRIGFFGQYRREKHLENFLEAYFAGQYTRPVELFVQGATMHPEDADDFERIIKKYQDRPGIRFLHKGLIGAEWQRAILGVDALLLPYSAPRYRYHWGGMLFTAIGFERPVVASDDMNPEVFAAYHIGETFPSGDLAALQSTLESFINAYDERRETYESELAKAAAAYAPQAFAHRIVEILQEP